MKINLSFFFLSLMFNFNAMESFSEEDFKVVIMNPPPSDSSVEIPSSYTILANQPAVLIGAKPINFNGTYIAINHGITLKFDEKVFTSVTYKMLYDLGYAVSYFSTSAFKGDYYNGKYTAKGIDAILDHYKTDKISIVGLSNGGVASEMAMYYYGKHSSVDKLYAFGTPFSGFFVADLVTLFPFLSYPVSLIMQTLMPKAPEGEDVTLKGMFLSTHAFRKLVLRPYMDNHPDNRPEDVKVALSKTYFDFESETDFFANFSLAVLGFLQNVLLLTENDGITPYESGIRPGSILDDEFSDVGVHHIGFTENIKKTAEIIHDIITKEKSGNLNLRKSNNRNTLESQRSLLVRSNYQVPVDGEFILDSKNETDPYLFLIQKNDSKKILLEYDTKFRTNIKDSVEPISLDSFSNIFLKKYQLPKNIKSNLKVNSSYLDTDESVYLLIQEDIEAIYEVDFSKNPFYETHNNPNPILKLNIKSRNPVSLSGLKIEAYSRKVSNLDGSIVNGLPFKLNFNYNTQSKVLEAQTLGQKAGIYSVEIRLGNEDFVRNISSGYTVGTLNDVKIDLETPEKALENKSTIQYNKNTNELIYIPSIQQIESTGEGKIKFTVYDVSGRKVKNFEIKSDKNKNTYSIGGDIHNLNSLNSFFYFIKIQKEHLNENHKLLINPS